MLYCFIYINRITQPIADRIAQNVEFCFKFFVNEPGFCPWDLRLVPCNNIVLLYIINPMGILERLVLNYSK